MSDPSAPADMTPPAHDWRRELIYFLLPDRFSDEFELTERPQLDLENTADEYRVTEAYTVWRWDMWAISGRNRFQGGTLRGVTARLPYLSKLGVTAIWLGPVWKQRVKGVDENLDTSPDDDDPIYSPDTYLAPGRQHPDPELTFRPRDDYHGYAIQDFTQVDPRFGTKADLKDLVTAAHEKGIRVILDVQLNHTGMNFSYGESYARPDRPTYREFTADEMKDGRVRLTGDPKDRRKLKFGAWLDRDNKPMAGDPTADDRDCGVWPTALGKPALYSRRGEGNYGDGDFDQFNAQFRVADYRNRDLDYCHSISDCTAANSALSDICGACLADGSAPAPDQNPMGWAKKVIERRPLLGTMVDIWSEWITESGCDGFRIDAIKHVPPDVATAFCIKIRENRPDFLLIGEVGGSDAAAATYLAVITDPAFTVLSLNARRRALRRLAAGEPEPDDLTAVLLPTPARVDGLGGLSQADKDKVTAMDPVGQLADRVVTTLDDHDGLGLIDWTGRARRIAARYQPAAILPAAALLLFGPGIPCLYYGTEQALAGAPPEARRLLAQYGIDSGSGADRYLRETMFGGRHPRRAGARGLPSEAEPFDDNLPGFGPSGTCGAHVFRDHSPWFVGISAMAHARKAHAVLATGGIEPITTGAVDGGRFGAPLPEWVLAWARHDGSDVAVIVTIGAAHRPVDVQLRLPSWFAVRHLVQIVRVDGTGHSAGGGGLDVTVRPGSGLLSLSLGRMQPGEVQVLRS